MARRSPGQLEAEILAALWAVDEPCSPADVLEAIGADIAYVTVLSTLIRMHERGTLGRRPHARGHEYWPARTRGQILAEDMRKLLDDSPNRKIALQQLLDELPARDRQTLRTLFTRRQRPDG